MNAPCENGSEQAWNSGLATCQQLVDKERKGMGKEMEAFPIPTNQPTNTANHRN
jgi:hypothetical protein